MTDQPPYAAQPPQRTGGSGLAIGALVLGILALLLSITVVGGIVLGLVAIILGVVASGRAKRGRATGRGMAITGVVLGLLGLLISVLLIVVGVSLFNSSGGKTLTDCLKQAGSDQTAQQACQDEFRRKLENKTS